MSLYKEKIQKSSARKHSGIHKWMKNQMNRFIRRQDITDDDQGYKTNRKPTKWWEY